MDPYNRSRDNNPPLSYQFRNEDKYFISNIGEKTKFKQPPLLGTLEKKLKKLIPIDKIYELDLEEGHLDHQKQYNTLLIEEELHL